MMSSAGMTVSAIAISVSVSLADRIGCIPSHILQTDNVGDFVVAPRAFEVGEVLIALASRTTLNA
jgi:hypothetical protein